MHEKVQLVRDKDGGQVLEIFLVSAVATVLVIRAFLAATGYPQIGSGGLHIAHMLWGGLFMLISIFALLSFWNVPMRWGAAFLGGVGFGTFIDEIGKFITSDNDYFYAPSFAVMYVIFVLLFLAVRSVHEVRPLSKRERDINHTIRSAMHESESDAPSRLEAYFRFRRWLLDRYHAIVDQRWFAPALQLFFIGMVIVDIVTVGTLILGDSNRDQTVHGIQATSTMLAGLATLIGVIRLRKSRLQAYEWFQRGVVISILITQVFVFAHSQLTGMLGLIGHLMIYGALQFLIQSETMTQQQSKSPAPA